MILALATFTIIAALFALVEHRREITPTCAAIIASVTVLILGAIIVMLHLSSQIQGDMDTLRAPLTRREMLDMRHEAQKSRPNQHIVNGVGQ